MSMLATNPSQDPGRYDLTQLEDQKAFAAELMAADRRSRLVQRLKVGFVWLVLIAIIGWLLRLLNIDFGYAVANTGFVLEGIYLTLGVSLASITIATILALIGALGRLSPHAWAQGISGFYVSLFRGRRCWCRFSLSTRVFLRSAFSSPRWGIPNSAACSSSPLFSPAFWP